MDGIQVKVLLIILAILRKANLKGGVLVNQTVQDESVFGSPDQKIGSRPLHGQQIG